MRRIDRKPPSARDHPRRIGVIAVVVMALVLAGCGGTPPPPPDDDQTGSTTDAYTYGPAETLPESTSTVDVGDAGSVEMPATASGTQTSVAVAQAEAFHDGDSLFPDLSQVIAVRITGDLAFESDEPDAPPVLTLRFTQPATVSSSSAGTSAAFTSRTVGVVRARPIGTTTYEWSDFATQAEWSAADSTYGVQLVDPAGFCDSLSDSTTVTGCEVSAQVVETGQWLADAEVVLEAEAVHGRAGLHLIDTAAFAADGALCDPAGPWAWSTHESQGLERTMERRTAMVFVHGWMLVAGWKETGDAGDTLDSLYPHCTGWSTIMRGIGEASGVWRELRDGADVYTFRYDSNRRVALNGQAFSDSLGDLFDMGYENLVLVGHSMGGLVIHDARQRAIDRGTSPSALSVVTLGTPYMGGPLLCIDASATECLDTKNAIVSHLDAQLVTGVESTKDLTTALSLDAAQLRSMGLRDATTFTENPYLLGLWDSIDLTQSEIHAFIGSSAEAPFLRNEMYFAASSFYSRRWGANDGIVPVASGAVAATLDTSLNRPDGELGSAEFVGRDHGYVQSGCEERYTACPQTGLVADPHLDRVASRIRTSVRAPLNAPTMASSVATGALPSGNWRVAILHPSLLTGTGPFQQIGASAAVASDGAFTIELADVTPPAVALRTPVAPTGVTIDPASVQGATFSLIAFDDANGNALLDGGELLYELDDPANTFGTGAAVLEFTDRAYTMLGVTQTDAGTPVTYDVTSPGGWVRSVFRTVAAGSEVEISASATLAGVTFVPGRSTVVGASALGALHAPAESEGEAVPLPFGDGGAGDTP